MPNLPGANGNGDVGAAPVEKFSLFISGIPASLSDGRLQEVLEVHYSSYAMPTILELIRSWSAVPLFQTVGSVLSVRRIRDASGVPKGFAFVEYGDAEAVLRCLELLNGVSLIGKDRETKNLTVKADAKLRARLDEHEAGRAKTSVSVECP